MGMLSLRKGSIDSQGSEGQRWDEISRGRHQLWKTWPQWWQTHIPRCHGNPGHIHQNPGHFHQGTGVKGPLGAWQHSSTWGSWHQTRIVQENQQEEEVTNNSIEIPGKGTAGGKQKSWYWLRSTLQIPRDISFLQATSTSMKLDTMTLAILHHFQTSTPGGRVSAVCSRKKLSHGSRDSTPMEIAHSGLTWPWSPQTTAPSPASTTHPTPDSPAVQQVVCFPMFYTEECFVPILTIRTKIAKTVAAIPKIEVPINNLAQILETRVCGDLEHWLRLTISFHLYMWLISVLSTTPGCCCLMSCHSFPDKVPSDTLLFTSP